MLTKVYGCLFAVMFSMVLIHVAPIHARDVTLAWDPNSEPDLVGYKLYYKKGTGGPPYNGTEALQGASPIDVENVTTVTLTGLSDAEDYFFVVTAYDTENLESVYSNEVIVRGVTVNKPPVANAGPDQTVNESTTVTLSAVNSVDPDDGIATYHWKQVSGPNVEILEPSARQTSFTSPDVGIDGAVLTFQLTVSDYGGNQASDQCLVNVTWVNESPVADAGPEQSVYEGDTATLDASESYDIDDGIASYLWEQTEGTSVALSDPSSAQVSFVAPDIGVEGESLTFLLTVTDSHGLKAVDSCIVTVLGSINDPPIAEAGPDQTANEGDGVLLDGSSSNDSDDGIASYLWAQTSGTPAEVDDPAAVQPRFSAPTVGSDGEMLTFELTVTDKGGLRSKDKCNVTVHKASMDQRESLFDLTGSWTFESRISKGKGSWIQGLFKVENLGTEKVQTVSVRFYLSFDRTLDEADVQVGNYIVKNIEAEGSETLNIQLKDKLIGNDSAIYVIAEIDSGNTILESIENNNIIVSSRL